FFFHTGMNIDADGAPNAYHPTEPIRGLDYIQNARQKDGSYCGVVTKDKERREPVVQKDTDICPGFLVSPTSLRDTSLHPYVPHGYLDSSKLPYLVLPGDWLRSGNPCALGDFAMVINAKTGRRSGAIVADAGPPPRIGEGS